MTVPFILQLLPYDENALAPVISGKTVGVHYHKHHRTYVDTLNKLVEGTKFSDMTLEEVVRATLNASDEKEKKIFNNAGQVWNHDFYWRSLSPKGSKPSGEMGIAIERDFGSLGSLIQKLAETGKEQFGSGWAWLVSKNGKLCVDKTANAVDPMAMGINCLLTVDVWEHAYYLDYQNERPKYLESVLSKLLNWDFAAENLAKESAPRVVRDKKAKGLEKTKQDVRQAFARPQDILDATTLGSQQKIELLKEWEFDLRELMVASEENMPGTAAGQTAELLRNVRQVLTKLGASEHEPAAINKAGG